MQKINSKCNIYTIWLQQSFNLFNNAITLNSFKYNNLNLQNIKKSINCKKTTNINNINIFNLILKKQKTKIYFKKVNFFLFNLLKKKVSKINLINFLNKF